VYNRDLPVFARAVGHNARNLQKESSMVSAILFAAVLAGMSHPKLIRKQKAFGVG